MKTILYLLSGVLVAPGVFLALFIWGVDKMIQEGVRRHNPVKALFHFLIRILQALDWAIWLVPFFLALWLALAFIPKYRFLGALMTVITAITSLIEIFVASSEPIRLDNIFFPALSMAGLLISLWLVWDTVGSHVGIKP